MKTMIRPTLRRVAVRMGVSVAVAAVLMAGSVSQAVEAQADIANSISGTVSPSNAPNLMVGMCEVDGNNLTNCTTTSVDENGKYTQVMTPNSTVVVWASADGYLLTWLGQYSQSTYYRSKYSVYLDYDIKTLLDNHFIVGVDMPDAGGAVGLGPIDLVKASSISGKVTLPNGYTLLPSDPNYSWYYYVNAYEINPDTGEQYGGSRIAQGVLSVENGTYSIDGLAIGSQWMVVMKTDGLRTSPNSDDLLATAYGGYASSNDPTNWDMAQAGIISVTAQAGGTKGINIKMAKQSIVCDPFTDVPSTYTFYNAICWVRAMGITKGTGDGTTYSPSNPVNRGSMAAFLYRLAGSPKWDPPKESPFVDVKTTDTFYPAITWLYSQGITVGTTVGGKVYYQPGNAVNRGSMSAFLYRFAASPKWTLPAVSPFADVDQTNGFYKSITWLADQKITVGSTVKGKLVYQPSNPVNRGSMAAFMQRLSKTELQCTKFKSAVGC